MIKKLRIKLITASMLSIFMVLLIIMSFVGALNYKKIVNDADNTLMILMDNGGRFPEGRKPFEDKPEHEQMKRDYPMISPELPYESRYFLVFLNDKGEVTSVNTGKISAVDTSAAISYAEKVWNINKNKGFADSYRYMKSDINGENCIIFLDCLRSLDNFKNLVTTICIVSIIGLLAVFALAIMLSGRIMRPFLENYEKQKQFITDAGHELKTPITIIDADSEILEMDFGESQWIDDIRNQTRRLSDLTNNLILLSKMEEGHDNRNMIEFPFSDIVEEEITSFKALAKTQNKELESDVQKMISLCGDEKSLRQLIEILMDNAMKYSEEKGKISVSLQEQKNSACLRIYNTTKFISQNDVKHLFDRFYRTDKSRNSQTEGYGLGLSIAAAIVKTHKGKITAVSDDEKSLTVTVMLPL